MGGQSPAQEGGQTDWAGALGGKQERGFLRWGAGRLGQMPVSLEACSVSGTSYRTISFPLTNSLRPHPIP